MSYSLPEKFEEFADARKAGFLRVKEVKEKGGKVAGIFCTFTPVEILMAAGFTAVSLCGMSPETIPDAEAHLPKNMCPLIKSSYGFAVSDKCPYTYFSDLIVGETTCDGKKKMYELLGRIKPTYILHLP
jgi:benzoyl-CoA reductase/2-hydroxyglutaryl-CoA dehydratase subunit BcrC/BadD/HgdB